MLFLRYRAVLRLLLTNLVSTLLHFVSTYCHPISDILLCELRKVRFSLCSNLDYSHGFKQEEKPFPGLFGS